MACWQLPRLDPPLDTQDHAHASLAEMLKALDTVIEIQKGETDHLLGVRRGAMATKVGRTDLPTIFIVIDGHRVPLDHEH